MLSAQSMLLPPLERLLYPVMASARALIAACVHRVFGYIMPRNMTA